MTTMNKNSLLVQTGAHGKNDATRSSKEDHHCCRSNISIMFRDSSHHLQDDDHTQGRSRKRGANHVSSTITCFGGGRNEHKEKILQLENKNSWITTRSFIWVKQDSPTIRCSNSGNHRHIKIRKRDRLIWINNVCLVTLGVLLLFVTGSTATTTTSTATPVIQRTANAAFSTAPTRTVNSQQSTTSCMRRATEWNQQARRRILLQTQLSPMKTSSSSSSTCSRLYMIMKNNNRIRNSHSSSTSAGTKAEEKKNQEEEFSNKASSATTTTTKDVIQGSNPANSLLNQPKSVNVVREDAAPLKEIKTSNVKHVNTNEITANDESHKTSNGSHSNTNESRTIKHTNTTNSSKANDVSSYPAAKKVKPSNNSTSREEDEDSKESIVDAIGRLASGLLPSSGGEDENENDSNKKEQKQSSSEQSSDTNPFDWRSSMNRLSFGGNDQEEQQRRQRRSSKERYRMNPEEAKELDKNVVQFSSTDDAMMGLQVLPTTLSPTVVVASSSTLKQKPPSSSSTSTTAATSRTQDSTSLGEKLSKRRLMKQWTKEVLQSSSTEKTKKGDHRRTSNSKAADKRHLKEDDVMLGGGRIHRDLREVAVSIASNIDTIDQYKVFHSEGGSTTGDDGSGPLQQIFQSLKVSARLINVASEQSTELLPSSRNSHKHKIPSTPEGFYYYYCGTGGGHNHGTTTASGAVSHLPHSGISMEDVDHAFATACTACRALRDLCALSPELSSVITEAILDASTAASSSTVADSTSTATAPGGVVAALASLLNYSIEKSNQAAQRHHHENNNHHGFMGTPQPPKQGALMNQDVNETPETTTNGEDSFDVGVSATASSLMEEKARLCQLYVIQLCLAMTLSSDAAVYTLRHIPSLKQSIMKCSSYANYRNDDDDDEVKDKNGSKRSRTIWNLFRCRSQPSETMSSSSQQQQFQRQQQKTMIMEQHHVIPVLDGTFDGRLRGASNQLLAALGYNVWVPKKPLPLTLSQGRSFKTKKRRGLRILCIDGGGTRGIAAITSLQQIVRSLGGIEICDSFDIVAGTSTGAIISFLVALRRETSNMTRKRYDMLIKRIFVKSPLSTPMLVFTTASYDESHFMTVMDEILGDDSMLESRVHPNGPYVFAVSTKMSSTPTTVCLFRNYNYSGGELPDSFVIPPQQAKQELELMNDDSDDDDNDENDVTFLHDDYDDEDADDYDNDYFDDDYVDNDRRSMTTNHDGSKRAMKDMLNESNRISHINTGTGGGSRNPGSFRIPQKVALRATTAAPTVFKPILMGGELYCDGGMLASNPTAIAIHEARTLFPDIPIDCVVSLGTGGFREVKSSPRIGWDGIITQIVNSATDAEQPHHILEDILGQGTSDSNSGTKYFRFNPMIGLPDDFPLDNTDPKSLEDLSRITQRYMEEPIQKQKLLELSNIMIGSGNNSGEEENLQRQKGFLRRLIPF